jgi:hypothetical protein
MFVDTFEDLGEVRRKKFPKPKYYEQSIGAHVDQTPGLAALELRFGESIASKSRLSPGELAGDYLAALRGYSMFIKAGKAPTPTRVTFPFGLIKTRGDRPPPKHWRFDPGGIYNLVEALISLLEECPGLVPFVDGLDVCGHEEHAPNWLFAPAYVRFAEWVTEHHRPTTCRFHAGEWQSTPLHGLRRIAEFLSFDLPRGTPRRLGHALALYSDDWSRLASQRVDELMDDLVWAHGVLELVNAPLDLIRLLERTVNDLVPQVYPALGLGPTDLGNLAEAYHARQDKQVLRRIGFLAEAGGILSFPDEEPIPGAGPVDQLVVAHLQARSDAFPRISDIMPILGFDDATRSLEHLRLMLSDTYAIAASEVRDDLRWRSVVVEACPTSNVLVGGVRGYYRHPSQILIENGVLVTVGSDDPSLFHTWVGGELVNARELINVPARQVDRAQRLAVDLVAPNIDADEIATVLSSVIAELEVVAPD